jgi:hypothetical protein
VTNVDYTHFVGIDWSGAKGARHPSIAIAICTPGDHAPVLVLPTSGKVWSRTAVLNFLVDLHKAGRERPLIGIDCSFAPPSDAAFGYFRSAQMPRSGKSLWKLVDASCAADEDLGAASWVEDRHRREFYLGASDGPKAPYMRLRACERAFNAQGGGKPSSIFDAVGAAQVCKASFSGMRVLHRLNRVLPIWPFDAPDCARGLVVEIYARAFIRHAGLPGFKVRERDALDAALRTLKSKAFRGKLSVQGVGLSDHETDAILSAAGLRKLATVPRYWAPLGLNRTLARTEGWTFGVA